MAPKAPATPVNPIRDFCAHVIQLCHMVEDLRIEKKLTITEIGVVTLKAGMVGKMAYGLTKLRPGGTK